MPAAASIAVAVSAVLSAASRPCLPALRAAALAYEIVAVIMIEADVMAMATAEAGTEAASAIAEAIALLSASLTSDTSPAAISSTTTCTAADAGGDGDGARGDGDGGGGGSGGAMTVGALTVVMADWSMLRSLASVLPMSLIVSTVEEATSELAEPSFVTVTSASTALVPTDDVMEPTPSSVASVESSTVGAGMLAVELVLTA